LLNRVDRTDAGLLFLFREYKELKMAARSKQLVVKKATINVSTVNGQDYICLTDMVRDMGGSAIIEKWLRNKNTIEFLGIWEILNNPNFNSPEFEGIRAAAGSNRFVLSAKQWVESTRAIGIRAQAGRYGGTYAHKDIAFEFGGWVNPEFKLIMIKEFQRLKEQEMEFEQWDYRRFLTKVNYKLHTSAVSSSLVSVTTISKSKTWLVYAEEADLINMALFGQTAKEWRTKNPKLAKSGQNIRDHATIHQLTVLANIESMNSMFITQGMSKNERFSRLTVEGRRQLRTLSSTITDKFSPLTPRSNAVEHSDKMVSKENL
jgi:hypothetical protein